jgi:DNA-binding beta-propeller fold protein YncE
VALDRDGDLFVAYASADRVAVLPAASGTVLGVPVVRGRLTTVAGDGTPGDGGDGGPAVRSGLDDPGGLAADATGDLFIADTGNCRIRMVAGATGVRFGVTAVAGEMTTVAGDGICGSAGDGGPAGQAEIWDPGALAVDPDGDLLVADQGNRTIRVLAGGSTTVLGVAVAAGDVATVAGEGSYGPYLVDGLSALNETAELNFPTGLAVDAHGDLFVADGAMHAIRMVPAAATVLRGRPAAADDMYTVAGALSVDNLDSRTSWIQTRMLDPTGLAVAPDGRLVYADAGADEVRELPAGS